MVLNAGAKLGPYEIVAPLGAGGMGEVYRARDTRLGREVALKILPPAFASDPSRRARFELEARAAAALNHPNIVGIFDFGSQDGAAYIVSELVKGETLAAVIERGPVPIRKLLDIATQVADGISAAHAAKITHRDLKPANIMIAEDGRAKILDFGLARQMPSAAAAPDATATMHHTSAGLILGTVNYMSPEQARGQEVDPRSDQFSFGLILYEMAAGKRAFERDEAVQVMSAILTDEPPPLEAKVPAPLRWSIERCLAKDPRDRYESTRDLFQELRYLRDHLSEASLAATAAVMPAASSRRGWWKLPAAFAAGVLLAAGVAIWRAGPDVPDQASYRFTPFSFEAGGQCCAYWSRDGTSVAYSARRSAQEPRQVYLRYLDSPTPLQLTRIAEDAAVVGWAADAKHVLFNRKGSNPAGIWSVASVGGEPEFAFATPDSARVDAVSPDGRAYAALRAGPDQQYGVWYAAPPGSPLKKYTPEPFAAHDIYNEPKLGFSPDGKQILLYLARGRSKEEAWLLPFPPDPSHPPRLVLQNVTPHSGTPPFCWMPDNRHVILSFAPDTGDATQLWMADTRSGALSDMTSGTESRSAPAISPDGKRLVYSSGISSTAIVSVDLATAALHPLMTTERAQLMPAWAAKAAVMAYVTDRNGPQEIWLHTAEADRPLVPGAADRWLMSPTPSPDASRVAYTVVDRVSGATRLWMISTRGGAPIQMTNDSSSGEFAGSWSPDGVWFAYLSLHRGTMDLMKVKSSGESAPVVVKPAIEPANVSSPAWSPAGDWIAYNDRGERLIAPDGSKSRDLGDHKSLAVAFSADGKTLYGIRTSPGNALLFAMDIASGNEKTIGPVGYGNEPRSFLNPGLRLSLSPDGRSVAYTTIQYKSNLWMLEGFSK